MGAVLIEVRVRVPPTASLIERDLAAVALQHFRMLYNEHWLIQRHCFQSPVQTRQRLTLTTAASRRLDYGACTLSKKTGGASSPSATIRHA